MGKFEIHPRKVTQTRVKYHEEIKISKDFGKINGSLYLHNENHEARSSLNSNSFRRYRKKMLSLKTKNRMSY